MLSSIYTIPFDRVFSGDELSKMIKDLFEVNREHILIRADRYDWDNYDDSIEVVCTMVNLGGGEFPVLLDLSQKGGYFEVADEIKTIEKICDSLNCRALLDTDRPLHYLEISGTDKQRLVITVPVKGNQGGWNIVEYL
jgi:hypothetical protein